MADFSDLYSPASRCNVHSQCKDNCKSYLRFISKLCD